jgi:hypothetical protein
MQDRFECVRNDFDRAPIPRRAARPWYDPTMRRLAIRAVRALTWLCLSLLCVTTLAICVTCVSGNHVWVTSSWADRPSQIKIRTRWLGVTQRGVVWGGLSDDLRVPPSRPEELDLLRQDLREAIGPAGRTAGQWSAATRQEESWRYTSNLDAVPISFSSSTEIAWGPLMLTLPAIPLPPIIVLGVVQRLAGRRKAKTGRCHRCGYDLTGNVSGVCPECGTSVAKASFTPRRIVPISGRHAGLVDPL